jgi:hypothetical protein
MGSEESMNCKNLALAFFFVVAIKSNLSTFYEYKYNTLFFIANEGCKSFFAVSF